MRIALPSIFGRAASPQAALPPWALPLWRLAHLAVGDDRSATALVAEVLLQHPAGEGAAVKLLAERLPSGWLSWPGAASPGEWLRLRLRREQTDRLLSVLGEWSAAERLALGLYLLWDVPRDELDAWIGSKGMADAVVELIAHVGDSLDMLPPPSEAPACEPFHADLIEAHQRTAPQQVRLHLLGCPACNAHADGLARSTALVRHALDVFFRQQPPANIADVAAAAQRGEPRTVELPLHLLPLALVALIIAALVLRPHRAPPAAAADTAQPALNAAAILDRSLDRFAVAPTNEVFHEQAQAGTGTRAVLIDRWTASGKRVRVTVRPPSGGTPVFDLSSDGTEWISYRAAPSNDAPSEALLRPPDAAALFPLLRQLPFVGSFGDIPVAQDALDVALIFQARRGSPALLGTRRWNDRTGYLLSTPTSDGTLLLLVDTQQFSLLQAQIVAPQSTTPQTLWQAIKVETLPAAPRDTFSPLTKRTARQIANPRHLLPHTPHTDLLSATRSMSVPIPTALPEPLLVSHLGTLDGFRSGVLQLYEAQQSTFAIVTSQPFSPLRPMFRTLDQRFRHGSYTVLEDMEPQTTIVAFSLDGDPSRRSAAYLWHALADDAARERMVLAVLDSITLADNTNAAQFADRFTPPAQADSALQSTAEQRKLLDAVPAHRRYARFKILQSMR